MPKCPGMDQGFWKRSDIVEVQCLHCGGTIEFWKDDVKRTCPSCKKTLFHPKLESSCLSWCQSAAECLGNQDIEEWKRNLAGHSNSNSPKS